MAFSSYILGGVVMLTLPQLMQMVIAATYHVLIMPIEFRGFTFNLYNVFEYSLCISAVCFFVEKVLFFWRDKQ